MLSDRGNAGLWHRALGGYQRFLPLVVAALLAAPGCTPEGDPFPGFVMTGPGVDGGPGPGPGPVGEDGGPTVVEAGNGCVRLLPLDSGTLYRIVASNITEKKPVGSLMESAYWAGGPGGSGEFLRGFVEFEIPSGLPFGLGTLFLQEATGVAGVPVDPIPHTIGAYVGDGNVNPGDYDAPSEDITTLSIDVNDGDVLYALDVLDQVVASVGGGLGFRVKMLIDPMLPADPSPPGAEFLGIGSASGPFIELCP